MALFNPETNVTRGPMKGLVNPELLPRAAVPERWQPKLGGNEGRRAPTTPFAPPTTNTPSLGGLREQGFRVPNMRGMERPQPVNYGQLFQGLPQTTRDQLALQYGVHSGNIGQLGSQFGHLFQQPSSGQPQNLQELYNAASQRYPARMPRPGGDVSGTGGSMPPQMQPPGLPPSHVRPNPYFPPGTGGAMPRPMSPGGGRPNPLDVNHPSLTIDRFPGAGGPVTSGPRPPFDFPLGGGQRRMPDLIADALERYRQPT